ncbi:hypothetical protein PZB75_20535 [Streptomyces sp. AM 4-1-1]|uniref:hypothetical protein n=1 Tax=Streptomyces sp. AM 4-1-1 TaxID=3028710 RepID=UPI0023BA025E|nr:hypothetical protein [Streptomyces sp. AM 4-1-1]WEH35529.1 hypothetical protein PZB75_20535 [Streptomyces sp. AM 4-1-1]
MKQSVVRTLGAAALGAAFAAAAGGTASAAPLPIDVGSAGSTLKTVTQTLPLQATADKLLQGKQKNKADKGTTTAGKRKTSNDATDPVKGLLGGISTNGLTTSGLTANGIPLGR